MLWFKHLVCKLLTETQQADLTDKALDGTREAPPFLGNGAQIRIHIVVSSCLIIVGDELDRVDMAGALVLTHIEVGVIIQLEGIQIVTNIPGSDSIMIACVL